MAGWIKIHRDIVDHWIFKDSRYLKWWMIILLNVNHRTNKVAVGFDLHECKEGESFRSVETWSEMFQCSKRTTLRFFELLKKDGMIERKIIGKGNRRKHLLTLVNWKEYQETETLPETGNDTERDTEVAPLTRMKRMNKNERSNKADFLSKIIETFQAAFFDIFQTEYEVISLGKERAAAGKILQIYKKRYPESTSDETLASLAKYFMACCQVPDEWIRKNMSLSTIVLKFNEINNAIKNGKHSKIRSVASRSSEIESIVSGIYNAKGI